MDEEKKGNIIPDILQKMAQVCPVSCFVFVSMDSNFPDYITLQWRWKIKERLLRYSIRIMVCEISKSHINIIQTHILPLKDANWQVSPLLAKKKDEALRLQRPSCFGSYIKSILEVREGKVWKCNCDECPVNDLCRIEEVKLENDGRKSEPKKPNLRK